VRVGIRIELLRGAQESRIPVESRGQVKKAWIRDLGEIDRCFCA
jgi:hypothetical protein